MSTVVVENVCKTYARGGQARICGFDVQGQAMEVRRRIAVVLQQTAVEGLLTVEDNFRIYADFLLTYAPSFERPVNADAAGTGAQRQNCRSASSAEAMVGAGDSSSASMLPAARRAADSTSFSKLQYELTDSVVPAATHARFSTSNTGLQPAPSLSPCTRNCINGLGR